VNLTDKQTEAIESWSRGDVSIVAGPGSGKTTVLVEHFRWLVERRNVPPHHIVAITFTEKAANNMHERLVREAPTRELRERFERAQISTIDAFCNRLLREHALDVGLDPDFRILDPSEQEVETRRVVGDVLNEMFEADPAPAFEFLEAFAGSNRYAEEFQISHVHDQFYQLYVAVRAWDAKPFVQQADQVTAYRELIALLNEQAAKRNSRHLSNWAQSAPPPPSAALAPEHLEWLGTLEQNIGFMSTLGKGKALPKTIAEDLIRIAQSVRLSTTHGAARRWVVRVVERIGEVYAAWKRANAALDFPDLVEQTVRFLDARPELRSSFHHILIDEYQDTNTPQAKLAKLLRGDTNDGSRVLYAVGDINQSIYGFRHADPEVFRAYRQQVERDKGHLIELRRNFRSRPEILKAVGTILRGAAGIEPHELTAGETFAPKDIPSVEVLITRGRVEEDPEAHERREILHTAARIFELHESLRVGNPPRPVRWNDFAILLRTHSQVSRFAATLRDENVPYQLSAGRGFFETPEVRDLVHFLRILRNPRDEIGLAAVLRSPLVGLSDEALLRMKLSARNLADSLRNPPPLDPGDAARFDRFRPRCAYSRRVREEQPADLLLSRLVAESGYEAWLLTQPGGLQQAANVQKLLAVIRSLTRLNDLPFAAVVERLERLREVGTPETEASVQDSAEDAVHLMTMHAAKGLEFPVVFLPAVGRGPGFDTDPLLYAPEEGIGISWLDAATGESFGDAAYRAIREKRKLQDRHESDRLLYVAMTRAEEHLVLSASFKTTLSPKGKEGIRVEHGSKYLRDNLGIDPQQTDDRPTIQQREGFQFRLFRTTEDPSTLRPVLEHPQASRVAWIDRAEPANQSDSEAAVTSIALFADCPRRYYLSRYLGFTDARIKAPDLAGADAPAEPDALAELVRLAELDNRAETTAPDDALAPEADETDATELGHKIHAVLAGSSPLDSLSGEALHLVENFHASELGKRAAAAQTAAREQHLTFAIGEHLLRGQIDLWFDHDGERLLVDYKTDQVDPEQARERLRSYGLQLQLYALALEQAGGQRPTQAVAYFLRPNLALDVDLSPQALDGARDAVRQFFAAQANVEFPLQVGEHCLRCPHYRGLCPARLTTQNGPESSDPDAHNLDAHGRNAAPNVSVEAEPSLANDPSAATPVVPPRQQPTQGAKQPRRTGQLSLPFQNGS
jgi:ATP-dependent helicase/nuclease subunit A